MYKVESCIRGFHVYLAVWTPYIGKQLDCVYDSGNSEDPFTVAVQKDGEMIGHVLTVYRKAPVRSYYVRS